jgi:hypothetical protein
LPLQKEVLVLFKKDHVSKYINKHWNRAKYVQGKFKLPGGLCLAMMCLESGWGSSKFAKERNNHLGIKFEGVYAHFDKIEDCLNVYGRTLNGRCYKGLGPRTLNGWLYALEDCHYFMSKTYKEKIKSIVKTYKIPLNL